MQKIPYASLLSGDVFIHQSHAWQKLDDGQAIRDHDKFRRTFARHTVVMFYAHAQFPTQKEIETSCNRSQAARNQPHERPQGRQQIIAQLTAENKSAAFIDGYLAATTPTDFNRFQVGTWQWRDYEAGATAARDQRPPASTPLPAEVR